MRAAGARFAAVLLAVAFFFSCTQPAAAVIEYSHITRDDRSVILLAQPFGYGSKGHITITLKKLTLYRRHDQAKQDFSLKNLGILLTDTDSQAKLESYLRSNKCPLQDADLRVFTFDTQQVQNLLTGEKEAAQLDIDVKNGGLASLFFINCEPGMPASFAAKVEQYNLIGDPERKDYLAVGETELDIMFWFMFALFSGLAGYWALLLLRSPKEHVQHIHWLMLALVVFKSLTLFGQAVMYLVIERQGSPHGWNWVYYTFTGLRGLLFFTVVILIGTGWSFMNSHVMIEDRTKQVLLLVIPLQVLANLAIIITSEESPAFNAWLTWKDLLHLVDIVCCCAVLFPIMWSIRRLKEEAEFDGKAARALVKLQQIREFYTIVVAFIWVTRIGVFMLETFVDWRYKWTVPAVNELAVLTLYVVVGTKFQPAASNPNLWTRAPSQDGLVGV